MHDAEWTAVMKAAADRDTAIQAWMASKSTAPHGAGLPTAKEALAKLSGMGPLVSSFITLSDDDGRVPE